MPSTLDADQVAEMAEPVPTVETVITEERERQSRHREREELKLLRGYAAEHADFFDALRGELRAFPPTPLAPPAKERTVRGRPATLLLHASDWHLGQLFQSYRNGIYNLEVATERISRMADKVIAITEAVRAQRTVDRLVIAWGGDIVDGRDIHPGHDWQSAPLEVQLNRGTQIVRDHFMFPLGETFARVDNISVPGNHGRVGKKGQLHRVLDSHDTIFYQWLADRCSAMPHVTWHAVKDYYCHFTLDGHNFVLAHGDAFKSWAGIPFYGAGRYLQRLSSMLHLPIDALLVGHHHNAASWMAGHATISMNGAMVAGGEFATWLGYGGPAIQRLLLVEERFAVGTSYDLVLTERDEVITARPLDLGVSA